MKLRNLIGIILLALFISVLMVSFADSVSEYTNFTSARSSGNEVHIVAQWVRKEEAHYDNQRDLFSFYLQDSTQNVQLVHYYDPMPANFRQADRVVVSGKYEGEVFVADKILMKCPSKYNETQAPQGYPTSAPGERSAEQQTL